MSKQQSELENKLLADRIEPAKDVPPAAGSNGGQPDLQDF